MAGLFRGAALTGAGMLLMGLAAAQQPYYGPQQDPYYRGQPPYDQGRDPYYGGGPAYSGRGYGAPPMSIVGQTHADLEQAMTSGFLSHGDRKTLQHAQKDLYDFERAWSRGRFSRHELDEAIGRIQSVADRGRLPYEARDMLQADANQLRDLRGGRAYGGRPYGYR